MKKLLILAALLCPLAHGATIACITTPGTYDATLGASWVGGTAPNIAGGDLITCATSGVKEIFTADYIIGNFPATGTLVINFTNGSTLGVGQNVTLTSQGDAVTPTLQRAAGGSIKMESSGAGTPSATPYTLTTANYTDDATHPPTNTTGNQFTITADTASGSPVLVRSAVAGAGIAGLNATVISNCGTTITVTGTTTSGSNSITGITPALTATFVNKFVGISGAGLLANATISNFTSSTITMPFGINATASGTVPISIIVPCFVYAPGGSGVVHIGDASPVTFNNTTGLYFANSWTVNDGFNLDITFKNTIGTDSMYLGAWDTPTGGVVRTLTNMVFDQPPSLQCAGCTWNNPFFYQAWNPTSNGSQTAVGTMNNPFIRVPYNVPGYPGSSDGGAPIGGFNMNFPILVFDSLTTYSGGAVQPPTPFKAGTLTAATTTLLTDSTGTFGTTMCDDGNTAGYSVAMTSGAAKGQARYIKCPSTNTTMTIPFGFTAGAAPGDSYAVYNPLPNPHFTGIGAPSTVTSLSYEHAIGIYQGCDATGDFFHAMSSPGVTYNMDYDILLPNPCRSSSGTFGTLGGTNTTLYSMTNDTYFTGEQSLSLYEGPNFTHAVTALQSSIMWADPSVDYVPAGGNVGTYKVDVSVAPSTTPIDIIQTNCFGGSAGCGDYNAGVGVVPFSASGNANGYCFTIIPSCDKSYNVNSSVALGLHDLNNVDPGWPNRWANTNTWTQSLGVDATQFDTFQILADTLNRLMAINDPSGYNSAFSSTNFYNYIQTQFTPTISAYVAGGAGGTYLGAVMPMLPPVPNVVLNGTMTTSGNVVW